MAVAARIGDAHDAAVGQPNSRRTLNVDDEGLARLAQKHDRFGAGSQRALLDGGAVWIRLVAGVRAPPRLQRRIEAGQGLTLRGGDQVVRPGVRGTAKSGISRLARSLEFRFVVAGQETLTFDRHHAHGGSKRASKKRRASAADCTPAVNASRQASAKKSKSALQCGAQNSAYTPTRASQLRRKVEKAAA